MQEGKHYTKRCIRPPLGVFCVEICVLCTMSKIHSFAPISYYRHVRACVKKQNAGETQPNQKKFIQPALYQQENSVSSVTQGGDSNQHVVDLTSNTK